MIQSRRNDEETRIERLAMAILVQVVAVVVLVGICLQIVAPFIGIVVWGIILAVALYPVHLSLASRLGGRQILSATLLVIISIAVLMLPTWIMADSSIASAKALAAELRDGAISIPPPSEKVREWPVIGERVHAVWRDAASDLQATVNQFKPQLVRASKWLLRAVGDVALGVLHFFVSIVIAGVFLVSGKAGYAFSRAFASRIAGERGQYLTDLSVATIRSVTKGVLGVALIQSVLATIGLVVMGVPAAGVWGAIVLVTAIVQIPTILILGPIAFWVFSMAEPVPATIFAIYAALVSLSDNVLKPILLGRGVDLPMLVILIGTIGGAIYAGVIGLFIGAVVMALGYAIFTDWIARGQRDASTDDVEAAD